jgi:uncharacterized protein (DUF433 family)
MIDWTNCPDVESVPDRCSGAWVVKDSRVPVQGILDNAEDCTAEEIGTEIFELPVDAVRRVLRFAYQSELQAISKARRQWPSLSRDYQIRADVLRRKLAEIEKALRRARRRLQIDWHGAGAARNCLTLILSARCFACHRSNSSCILSQVSAVLPNACSSRIAISGEIPAGPLINSDSAQPLRCLCHR